MSDDQRHDQRHDQQHDESATRPAGATGDVAINPDHPDRTSAPGTGGLMPGNYEQAGGEAGHAAGDSAPPTEGVRAPGSRVPDPAAHPEARRAALDVADGAAGAGDGGAGGAGR